MNICVIGTGYVGLVSGACLAELGNNVVCVDKDASKISRLQRGEIPIYEPGLESLVAANSEAGRLAFSTDLPGAVKQAEIVFIAVGTPSSEIDGQADLTYVMAAAEEIATSLGDFAIVVTKSTVPVGTGARLQELIGSIAGADRFAVVSNPEFLREGSAIDDFMNPDRVVVGADDPKAQDVMKGLYAPLGAKGVPLLFTDVASAELTKYASNAFLATKISFINEMADLCEATGANVQDVARGMGLDRRIGDRFLQPGPGYGGSCFPKDTEALLAIAAAHRVKSQIVDATVRVNKHRKLSMAEKIRAAVGGDLEGNNIAILGLTFKPNTDDMRESPSLDIIPALQKMGASIRAYDPVGTAEARKLMPDLDYFDSAKSALTGADACVILTEWDEFRALKLAHMAKLLARPILVDLRNIYDPVAAAQAGLSYFGVGRPAGSVVESVG